MTTAPQRVSGPVKIDDRTYRWLYDHVVSRYYDVAIKLWALPFGGERKFRETLLAPVPFAPGERVLDLCCGPGGATVVIRERIGPGGEVVGLDFSGGQLRAARRRRGPGVRFVEGHAARTGFREGTFDKVVVAHALHEMTRVSRAEVLGEVRRVLRVDGRIVVLELDDPDRVWLRLLVGAWFFYWLPFNFETPTRRDMFRNGLTREVEASGFRGVTRVRMYRGVFQVVQGVK